MILKPHWLGGELARATAQRKIQLDRGSRGPVSAEG